MTDCTVPVSPIEVNCPVCWADRGQSCQDRDGFTAAAHKTRQVAAVAALTNGDLDLIKVESTVLGGSTTSPVSPSCPEARCTVADPTDEKDVLGEVRGERHRQARKGYTAQHDDGHHYGELIEFAESRLMDFVGDDGWDKPNRHMLVEAAALIIAAIERLDRTDLHGQEADRG